MRLKVAFQQCAARRLILYSRLKRPFNLIYEQKYKITISHWRFHGNIYILWRQYIPHPVILIR